MAKKLIIWVQRGRIGKLKESADNADSLIAIFEFLIEKIFALAYPLYLLGILIIMADLFILFGLWRRLQSCRWLLSRNP